MENNNALIPKLDKRLSVNSSNDFVRTAQIYQSAIQAKITRLAIGQIQKEDDGFYRYRVNLGTLAKFLDTDRKNIYQYLTDGFLFPALVLKNSKGKSYSIPMFTALCVDSGEVYFQLNSELAEYFLSLEGGYSRYALGTIIKLKTVNSIRLFELLLSYKSIMIKDNAMRYEHYKDVEFSGKDTIIFPIAALREVLGYTKKLKANKDFIQRVIYPSIEEINSKLDEKYSVEVIKTGDEITHISFKYLGKYIALADYENDNFMDYINKIASGEYKAREELENEVTSD